ncbi:MAG: hypothetical protein EZS28_014165 [Streblomastix strix]|uniref:Uncharacterized protein n=1 Tax=Streblomastix strix TaxID=222440 RepID=A0A5J4W623_9EUKA|nr:MAG: hypothetical protein EZS28_014165 [Streblomastix strix]
MAQAQQQVQLSKFQKWQGRLGQPLSEQRQALVQRMKAAGAAQRVQLEQAFNDTQIAALKEQLHVKKTKYTDIKYNKELKTLSSAQAYIGTKKNIRGWIVRNVDPDGHDEPLPNFATVYINKGKLYSMDGYFPKSESKYDVYQEEYIANVPKRQRKNRMFFEYMGGKQVSYGRKKTLVNYKRQNPHQHFISAYAPTMADEFNQTNGGELWKLKEAYMSVAAAAFDVVLRGLLARIYNTQDWNTVIKDTIKQAARIYNKQIAEQYFGIVDEDEVEFARRIENLYNQVAQTAYREKQLQVPALGDAGKMAIDQE